MDMAIFGLFILIILLWYVDYTSDMKLADLLSDMAVELDKLRKEVNELKGVKEVDELKGAKEDQYMKIPKINWIPFDRDNPPGDLSECADYLILLREDDYNNGATWTYHVDIASPYGSYIDDFWNTTNDWYEGQRVEVLAYAELPCNMKEEDLEED